MAVVAHVGDLIVSGNVEHAETLRNFLKKYFPMNSLRELTNYTGCSISRDGDNRSPKVYQTATVDKMLDQFSITSPSPLPACSSTRLRAGGPDKMFEGRYRQASGCLLWVANMSRPDISNAVREVARHVHDPKDRYWQALPNTVRYLKGT